VVIPYQPKGREQVTKDQVKEILQDLPIEVYTAVKWHIKEGESK
jgi:hypothetical protein